MTGQTYPIAVMDGTCALCAFGAKIVHRLDRSGDIRIAPIQGEIGAALMRDHGLAPFNPDLWFFIEEDGTVTRDLDALIRLGQRTATPVIPPKIIDIQNPNFLGKISEEIFDEGSAI